MFYVAPFAFIALCWLGRARPAAPARGRWSAR